jgi:hypothetical protein
MQNLVLFSALAFLSVIAGPPNAQNKTAATGGLYLTANDFE